MPYISKQVVIILISLYCTVQPQAVVINELMPVNVSTIADEDLDFSDWIELYNPHDLAVDLTGYGLSDDVRDPLKWVFPSVSLAPFDFLLIFASDKDRRELCFWNTVIRQGDSWLYRRGDSEPLAGWRTIDFDDSAWLTGASGFGYGDDDDATIVQNVLSIYVRTSFAIENPDQVSRLALHVDYDDAFVAYLNGYEIARANLGSPGEFIAHDRPADANHEALGIQGLPPERFDVRDLSMLRSGRNVLAMQVHNVDAGSSDMTLIPFLTIGNHSSDENSVPEMLNLPYVHLHTNFKLKGAGETVVLVDPHGALIDSVRSPALQEDVSFGRTSDGRWRVLALPTPGDANIDSAFTAPAGAPLFSRPGGLYDASLTIELSDTSGGYIVYTRDGSEPQPNGSRYSTPIAVQKTMCIRARSFHPSRPASPIVTHTYIFDEETEFAIVALASDPFHLYDYESGIFEYGPNASPDYPYYGANFWQDWERPVHVEFYEPDGETGFQLDAGMKVFGGWSRGRDQKSLAIFQRGKYDSRQIHHRIFPDKPIDHFESFILRNGGNAWDGTMFRDAFMQTLCRGEMDLETMAYRPAQVYLNGDYWGMLIIREKINEHFVAANRGLDPDRIDILDTTGRSSAEVMAGTNADYVALLNFIETHDLSVAEHYETAASMIDVNNFIDYQIAEIYFGNTDWPGNNIKYYKPQIPGGRWRWLIYDTDFGFHLYDDSYNHDTLAFATEANGPSWPNPPWSTLLLRSFLRNEHFRRLFINRFADHMNTTFAPARVKTVLDEFDALFGPEVHRQRQRWPGSEGQYSSRLTRMHLFADRRAPFVRESIRDMFNIAGDIRVTLDISAPGEGSIKINSRAIATFPWQGSYFKNVPITLQAIPHPGYRFVRWDGLQDGAMTVTYDSRAALTAKAIFAAAAANTADIVINEINYHSGPDLPAKEWLELYNPGEVSISLAGWRMRDADDGHFTLPTNASIPAHGFAILCTDTTHFIRFSSNVDFVYGDLPFGLSNAGDSLYLYDSTGRLVDALFYDDEPPWPLAADGTGHTLELRDPILDNADPVNWLASSIVGGTPGRSNSVLSDIGARATSANSFWLAQNYPNPFNGRTTIHYSLAAAGFVRLVVYDLLGREVATLVAERQSPGLFSVNWRADGPSGIYLCRLEIEGAAENVTCVKKMAFVR
ncbi:CotH kinase family protein [candidate division KSB1 bacterium]|nr:CotH kinase family protein [candidate division KSB1 bacterium]RQW03368.1 MAG: T9SS C-terminal target domain-containing protein [candidate division KSB1 bacterium]